jgi:hypothetical protein
MQTLSTTAFGVVLLAAFSSPSRADNIVVWRTINGVAQAGNVVGGIAGGGQPWSTREGEVLVELDSGFVVFEGHGARPCRRQYDRHAGFGYSGQGNTCLRTRLGQPDRH